MLTLEQPPLNNLSVSAASDVGVEIADETVVVVWETVGVEVNVVETEDGFFFFEGRVVGDEATTASIDHKQSNSQKVDAYKVPATHQASDDAPSC